MTIETEQLFLIAADAQSLQCAINGEQALSAFLKMGITPGWQSFGTQVFQFTLQQLQNGQTGHGWWMYFTLHKKDRQLIGNGGYKGSPTKEGTVEIGYEIAPTYRNQGLATEMAQGLIGNAFRHPIVKTVLAHTLAEENPSTRILQKCGFNKLGELNDPWDGLIWKWALTRK